MKTRKRTIWKLVTALCAAILLGWYCLPSVYRLLHLPLYVDAGETLRAPALSTAGDGARFVRESGDERLYEQTEVRETVRLFGLVPLRTVTVSSQNRQVFVGGEAVGIVLKTQGVQIVGIGKVDTDHGAVSPAADAGLSAGDMILAVDGMPVTDIASFVACCGAVQGACTLSCLRDGQPFSAELTPERDRDGTVRIGAWVRDSTSGIGTLSFYEAEDGRYTALGHGVNDVDTGKLFAPAEGYLTEAEIRGVRKGGADEAGELYGTFLTGEQDSIASIETNTVFGIAGKLNAFSSLYAQRMPIAQPEAAHLGDAYIRSTIDGTEVKTYRVRIIRVNVQSSPQMQGMMIEVVDPDLLQLTNGIVQGMSGSPLIQDGRLLGVVTHVFVSQPTRGYCLYAAWMESELMPST